MDEDFRAKARLWPKGNRWEDFEPGRRFDHHWGRTIGESENRLFTTLTLHYNPLYFNAAYSAAAGHPRGVVNPLLAFNIVFGLTVEDLSEGGGPFLGVDGLDYRETVYVGDTLFAASTVIDRRLSKSHEGFGIATWQTEGLNQHGAVVLSFQRTNLVRRRD